MVTIDKLKDFGADTAEGIARCAGKESLYLRLVGTIPQNKTFAALYDAVSAGDCEAAFQAAHGLKGALGNLSLKPLYEPVLTLTEKLRGGDMHDTELLITEIETKRKELEELCL